jgi:hypothetical protein
MSLGTATQKQDAIWQLEWYETMVGHDQNFLSQYLARLQNSNRQEATKEHTRSTRWTQLDLVSSHKPRNLTFSSQVITSLSIIIGRWGSAKVRSENSM